MLVKRNRREQQQKKHSIFLYTKINALVQGLFRFLLSAQIGGRAKC